MTRGIVIFGINNARVNYVQLAAVAAAFVKKNMPGVPVCLITDLPSSEQYESSELSGWFDTVKILPNGVDTPNVRTYRDTQYYAFKDEFKNTQRSSVYDLSPYDETLLIDCDYLICNETLNCVWGAHEDVLINKSATGLLHHALDGDEVRLNPYGIEMYWATVIFFRKSEKAKLLFDLVEHIKENWEFYKLTYEFPGNLFRNDYAFSIAIHMLNGFTEDDFAPALPEPSILTALDTDQFYGISSPTTLHFFVNDKKENWKFYATKTKGLNVHCMNKLSLLNNFHEIMETLI